MEGPARTRLVALVVILVVAVPLTIVAVAGSGGGDDEEEVPALRAERSPDAPELLVFLNPDVNKPERSDGSGTVTVECVNTGGGVVASKIEPWPFTDTDQNTVDPHAHIPVDPARMSEIELCRVRPARPPLEGPVS